MRVPFGYSILEASLLLGCGSDPSAAENVVMGSGGAGNGTGGGTATAAGASGVSSAAGAGIAGSWGSPPAVHAGDCANLPKKGQWENISPPSSNYSKTYTGINAIVLRSDDPSVIFVGADMAGIFRSNDCGATWSTAGVNTGTNGDAINTGRSWSLAIDPITPDTMYAVQGYGKPGLWKSTDAGVDWTQTLTPDILDVFNAKGQLTSVAMDPDDPGHLVVESHGPGAGACADTTCLAESLDSGVTWHLLSIPQAWSENSSVVLLSKQTWIYAALFGGLWQTTDQGKTWKKISDAYASANYYEPFIWKDAAGTYYLPTHQQGLLQSGANDPTKWSSVPNSASGTVLFPSEKNLFMADEFNMGYFTASQSAPNVWTKFPAPPQGGPNSQGGGGVYLNYDKVDHILYSANFDAGLWRVVVD
jgi:photosystem II stability/assembly factor-like uncharacterized protein